MVAGLPAADFVTHEDKGGGKMLTLEWTWVPREVGAHMFGDRNELSNWLHRHGVQCSNSEGGKTKPIDRLLRELNDRVCVLVLRNGRVVLREQIVEIVEVIRQDSRVTVVFLAAI